MIDIAINEKAALSPASYRARYQFLQRAMQVQQVDAHIIRDDINITYLTGAAYYSMERPVFLIARADANAVLVVPKMEEEHLQGLENIAEVQAYWEVDALEGRGWPTRMGTLLSGFKAVSIEPTLELRHFPLLSQFDPKLCPLVEEIRLIKSPDELAIVRRSGEIAVERFEKMLLGQLQDTTVGEIVDRGMGVDEDIEHLYGGACKLIMGLQAGPPAASPHYISRRDHVLHDEPCVVNSIVSYQGYNTECERTVLVGNNSPKVTDIFQCMLEAQQQALELVKPGEPCSVVDRSIQSFFISKGYQDGLRHRVGHGMGLLPHERPYISEGSTDIFKPGMVVSCEPGLYIQGVGGFRHSDTVVVTEEGYELLTDCPTKMSDLSFNH